MTTFTVTPDTLEMHWWRQGWLVNYTTPGLLVVSDEDTQVTIMMSVRQDERIYYSVLLAQSGEEILSLNDFVKGIDFSAVQRHINSALRRFTKNWVSPLGKERQVHAKDEEEPQTYEIMIDEQQRQMITDALDILEPDNIEAQACKEELAEMFRALPSLERASPGIVHGFCL